MLMRAVAANAVDIGALRRVVKVGEAGVVELEIGAAERMQAGDLLGVDLGEVVPERAPCRDRRPGRSPRARRGNAASDGDGMVSFARAACPDRRFEKGKIVAENGLVERELAADPVRGWAELDRAGFVLELDVEAMVTVGDPADLVEEIHVPGAAAHLAVGDALEPQPLLQRDPVADRLILGRAQRRRVDAASLMIGARLH